MVSVKIIGGLGYILSLIPFVNFVAPILVGIAWLHMGSKSQNRLFKAAGALMLASYVVSIAFLVVFFSTVFSLAMGGISPLYFFVMPFSDEPPPYVVEPDIPLSDIITNFIFFAGFVVALSALGIAAFVLELASHFRAGNIYNIRWFKAAAWLRIIAIIIVIAWVVVLISILSAPSLISPTDILTGAGFLFIPIIPTIIISIVGAIFSAVAFFKLPD